MKIQTLYQRLFLYIALLTASALIGENPDKPCTTQLKDLLEKIDAGFFICDNFIPKMTQKLVFSGRQSLGIGFPQMGLYWQYRPICGNPIARAFALAKYQLLSHFGYTWKDYKSCTGILSSTYFQNTFLPLLENHKTLITSKKITPSYHWETNSQILCNGNVSISGSHDIEDNNKAEILITKSIQNNNGGVFSINAGAEIFRDFSGNVTGEFKASGTYTWKD